MVQTWSQYLKYFLFNKLMKIAKYKYSIWTAGVRRRGVLVHRMEGKC